VRRRLPALLLLCALWALPAAAAAEAEALITRQDEHFTFIYRQRYWGSIRNTVAVADRARTKMIADLGVERPADRVEVRFARNVEEMREFCPRTPPGYANAVAFYPDNILVISLTSSHHRPVALETVFRHELSHLVVRWAVEGRTIPRWFNEGLAIYESGELPMDRMRVLWPVAASGNTIPLSELDRRFPRREYEVNLAYAQSADLVRYLIHHDGRWRVPELLRRVRQGEPFNAAMRATWGQSPAALVLGWKRDMRNRYTVMPSLAGGMTVWVGVGLLAFVAFVRRRRDIRRRIAAMRDEPYAGEGSDDGA